MSEFRRRMRRRLLAAGAFGAPAAEPAPEQDYLPFVPASSDHGYGTNAALGIGDEYTLLVKLRGKGVAAGAPRQGAVYDDTANANPDSSACIALTRHDALGTATYVGQTSGAGPLVNGWWDPPQLHATAVQVYGAHRKNATNRTELVHYAVGGTALRKGATLGETKTPMHVCVGALRYNANAVVAQFDDISLIAVVLIQGDVDLADVEAYAAADDARTIWPTPYGYWPVSLLSGGSIPNLGTGTAVPLTMVGPVAADLVALPAAVTSYYSSPGGAGDYAEASSNVAARVVFPGASAPVASMVCWARNCANNFMRARDTDNQPIIVMYPDSTLAVDIADAAGGSASSYAPVSDPAGASWVLCAAVTDGANLTTYGDADAGTPGALPGGAWSAADEFAALIASSAGDIRNIMLIDRALTAGEVAALYAAGPTHNPLAGTGAWAGGQSIPVLWCTPAVGGVVANSGDGGACNLVLSGAVTSEVD